MQEALSFEVTKELRKLQKQMSSLFLYQQKRGGIIDTEAEENKNLLVTQTVRRSLVLHLNLLLDQIVCEAKKLHDAI